MKYPKTLIICLAFAIPVLAPPVSASGQTKTKEPFAISSSCKREPALDIIQQQIDATRTFDDAVERIAVLLRAADLLWPHQQDKARSAFSEAFDLATVNFKEKGDKDREEGVGLTSETPYQRYKVISAIAGRDYPWAKKLTDQVLKQDADEAKE